MTHDDYWDEFTMNLAAPYIENGRALPVNLAERIADLADAMVVERRKRAEKRSLFRALVNGVEIKFDVHGWSQQQLEALQLVWHGFSEWQAAQSPNLTLFPGGADTKKNEPESEPELDNLIHFQRRDDDDCPSER